MWSPSQSQARSAPSAPSRLAATPCTPVATPDCMGPISVRAAPQGPEENQRPPPTKKTQHRVQPNGNTSKLNSPMHPAAAVRHCHACHAPTCRVRWRPPPAITKHMSSSTCDSDPTPTPTLAPRLFGIPPHPHSPKGPSSSASWRPRSETPAPPPPRAATRYAPVPPPPIQAAVAFAPPPASPTLRRHQRHQRHQRVAQTRR